LAGSGDYGDEDYPHSDGEGGPGGSLLGPYGETRWGLQALETVQKIVDSGVVLSQRVSDSILLFFYLFLSYTYHYLISLSIRLSYSSSTPIQPPCLKISSTTQLFLNFYY
jgi:hypothetical protein